MTYQLAPVVDGAARWDQAAAVHDGPLPAGLPLRRLRVLDHIRTRIREQGYAPTYQEIADAVGLRSKSDVAYHIACLVEAGLVAIEGDVVRTSAGKVRTTGRRRRTVRLVDPGNAA